MITSLLINPELWSPLLAIAFGAAEAFGHAARSRSVGFAETPISFAAPKAMARRARF
ncbi:MAG: hypothetical protein F6K65_04835 [Moorea sp. SIO3C2]|nr:hypothetical protein [Moorena sp. SIO3C2]